MLVPFVRVLIPFDICDIQPLSPFCSKEMEFLRANRHKRLVHCYGCGVADNSVFLVLEYLPGSLQSLLETTPHLPIYTKLRLLHDAAVGLEYLHAQGVVHRDIKVSAVA